MAYRRVTVSGQFGPWRTSQTYSDGMSDSDWQELHVMIEEQQFTLIKHQVFDEEQKIMLVYRNPKNGEIKVTLWEGERPPIYCRVLDAFKMMDR